MVQNHIFLWTLARDHCHHLLLCYSTHCHVLISTLVKNIFPGKEIEHNQSCITIQLLIYKGWQKSANRKNLLKIKDVVKDCRHQYIGKRQRVNLGRRWRYGEAAACTAAVTVTWVPGWMSCDSRMPRRRGGRTAFWNTKCADRAMGQGGGSG